MLQLIHGPRQYDLLVYCEFHLQIAEYVVGFKCRKNAGRSGRMFTTTVWADSTDCPIVPDIQSK
jgi:hypothetical protein